MDAERCLRAGAKGYVSKQELPQRLLEGVRRVLKGEVYLSEAITKQLLCQISSGPEGQHNSPSELLSDRESEVFELLGRRRRTREIAQLLHLSDKTIHTHREHIKERLNLNDAVRLVRQAVHCVEVQKRTPRSPRGANPCPRFHAALGKSPNSRVAVASLFNRHRAQCSL